MRTVGRIILIVVGVILIVYAVPNIIDSWKLINETGWTDFSSYPDKMAHFVTLITQAFNALMGLVAFLAGLFGRGSLLLMINAVIMIGGVIWYFVSASKAGTLGDFKSIMQTILGFALPIFYFVGSILIKF